MFLFIGWIVANDSRAIQGLPVDLYRLMWCESLDRLNSFEPCNSVELRNPSCDESKPCAIIAQAEKLKPINAIRKVRKFRARRRPSFRRVFCANKFGLAIAFGRTWLVLPSLCP